VGYKMKELKAEPLLEGEALLYEQACLFVMQM
jgi:hypothetical protein